MEQKVVWNNMFLIPLSNTISDESTGHVKVCVSVCLTGKANGRKGKLFIVFKVAKRGRESLNKEFNCKCSVATSTNRWINVGLNLY